MMLARWQTVRRALREGEALLHKHGIVDDVRLEAEMLLAHAIGGHTSAADVRLLERVDPGKRLQGSTIHEYCGLLHRRGVLREPTCNITASKGFWMHDFFVNKDVLSPRPETEMLVEHTLGLDLPPLQTSLRLEQGVAVSPYLLPTSDHVGQYMPPIYLAVLWLWLGAMLRTSSRMTPGGCTFTMATYGQIAIASYSMPSFRIPLTLPSRTLLPCSPSFSLTPPSRSSLEMG